MNPVAIAFWAFFACLGFLIYNSLYGAIAGLTVGLALTLMVEFSKGK